MVLSAYVSSQTLAEHSTKPKDLRDYFAEMGGLIGALLGASIITIVELIYFYFAIIKCCFKYAFKNLICP